jgi:hypothetical protein
MNLVSTDYLKIVMFLSLILEEIIELTFWNDLEKVQLSQIARHNNNCSNWLILFFLLLPSFNDVVLLFVDFCGEEERKENKFYCSVPCTIR